LVKKIGLLTIGQAPRSDITPEILSFIGEVDVVEAGALDGLSSTEIARLAPTSGETVYVTRLRDGREVKVSRERLIPLLIEKIRFLEDMGAEVIGLLCSGTFPDLKHRVPVVKPEPIVRGIVEGSISSVDVLGVIMPSSLQLEYARAKWSDMKCRSMVVDSVSPYIEEDMRREKLRQIAKKFKESNVALVVMDCMGFSLNDANYLRRLVEVPIIIPRVALALALKCFI